MGQWTGKERYNAACSYSKSKLVIGKETEVMMILQYDPSEVILKQMFIKFHVLVKLI